MLGLERRRFEDWVGEVLLRESPGSGLSIDVGCGHGRANKFFNNAVVGMDIAGNVRPPVVGSADTLPFRDRTFQFAASFQSYLFVDDIEGAIVELNRVLELDAIAVISLSKWYYLKRERRTHSGTVQVHSVGKWQELFEQRGFRVEKISVPGRYAGSLSFAANALSRYLGPYNLYKLRKVSVPPA